jgi:Relaxase/Mobilisation nuclease domain
MYFRGRLALPKPRIEPFEGRPLLDIGSFGRGGPNRDRLTTAQIAQIARTVHRAPEVMVKVLTRNSHDLASVRRHFGYLGRRGALELETDDGELVSGKDAGRRLVDDWNLELETSSDRLSASEGRRSSKLVHKLMLSMPAGTPPQAVLRAARNFLREEFALKHRYAFVLHTDEPHPHVHAVIKAVSEEGERLNIRKATLRRWRAEFARHLRTQGVAANATERAVRGQVEGAKLDPIYRAMRRGSGESAFMRAKVHEIALRMVSSQTMDEPGRARLLTTRRAIEHGWEAVARQLKAEGQTSLADAAARFAESMLPPRTDAERLATQIQTHLRRTRLLDRSHGDG